MKSQHLCLSFWDIMFVSHARHRLAAVGPVVVKCCELVCVSEPPWGGDTCPSKSGPFTHSFLGQAHEVSENAPAESGCEQHQNSLALFWVRKKTAQRPGRGAQFVRASPRYTGVAGSIPGQGLCENQPPNAEISGATNQCFSLSPLFPLSLKSIK